jgi:hypothetical protein
VHGVATTIADLAADLGIDEGDIDVVLELLGEDEPDLRAAELPDDVASFVRRLLDPHGERIAPATLYWPGNEPLPPGVGTAGPQPDSTGGRLPGAVEPAPCP